MIFRRIKHTILLSLVIGFFALGSIEAVSFDAQKSFPSWDGKFNDQNNGENIEEQRIVQGVIGINQYIRCDDQEDARACQSTTSGKTKILIYFIPQAINLLTIITAPLIIIGFIIASLFLIWGEEEDVTGAKKFLMYGTIGLILIITSYSISKVIFSVMLKEDQYLSRDISLPEDDE